MRTSIGAMLLSGLCALSTTAFAADLAVGGVFGSNMVLQQQRPARIHGVSAAGDEVTVAFAGQRKTATADAKGAWKLELDAMPASAEGRTLTVTSKAGGKPVELTNVLVGEVWVCSGQSNMGGAMSSLKPVFPADFTEAFPNIRFCSVPLRGAYQPKEDLAPLPWRDCAIANIDYCSAPAFYFGRDLYRRLNVPIGLIVSSNGGTAVECWLPKAAFNVDDETRAVLAKWESQLDAVPNSRETYDERFVQFMQACQDYYVKIYLPWTKEVAAAKAAGQTPPRQPPEPHDAPPFNFRVPNSLYNGMIHPLTSVTIRGVIWYQGENGSITIDAFRKMTASMIVEWRKNWGLGDFPFLMVQLPYYQALLKDPNAERQNKSWAPKREAQRAAAAAVPNVGLAVTLDTGSDTDLHPSNKNVVGARLALLARAMAYGEKIVCSGPVAKSVELADGKVRVRFDQIGGELVSKGEDGQLSEKAPVKGFALAGADGKFAWAEAMIDGDSVLVSCGQTAAPTVLRYAWATHPPCSLYNREGLPAGPFQMSLAPAK